MANIRPKYSTEVRNNFFGMTARQFRKHYNITDRQYKKLKREIKDIAEAIK